MSITDGSDSHTVTTVEDEDAWGEFWEAHFDTVVIDGTGVALRDARGTHWLAWTNEDGDTFARSYPVEGEEDEPTATDAQGITAASALEYPVEVWTSPLSSADAHASPESTDQSQALTPAHAVSDEQQPSNAQPYDATFTPPPNAVARHPVASADAPDPDTGHHFLAWGWMLAAPFILSLLSSAYALTPQLALFAVTVGGPMVLTAVRPVIAPWWALAGCSLAAWGVFAAIYESGLTGGAAITVGLALAVAGVTAEVAQKDRP